MRLWDTRDRQERELLLLLLLLLLNIFSFSLARLDRMGRCFLWSPQSSRTLWFSSVDEDYSRGRNAPKNPLDSFLFVFFSAKNLKYKNRKKHHKRIHLRKHTHTRTTIFICPPCDSNSLRGICNKIFFRCVSRAWEHREADRRERQQQEKKRKERKERKKKKKTVILKMNVEGITSSLTTTTERVIECIYRLSTPCPCLSLPPHTITEPPSSVKISFYIRNYSVLYIPMYYS